MIYISFLIVSIIFSFFVANGLINTKKDKSPVSILIKAFAGFGIAISIFGIFFLLYSMFANNYSGDNEWEEHTKINSVDTTKEIRSIKHSNFDFKTLKFDDDVFQTTSIIFTIAGIALGTLGVLWLGHLEATRLRKDRYHDQKVQKDRLLSLLSLGIDLFLFIDKKELDFIYGNSNKKYAHKKYNSIQWGNKYFFLLTKENIEDDIKLKVAYEKHLISLYQFLYLKKNFQKNSILSDVHKIIDELKLIYYEKDIHLYPNEDNNYYKKRNIFIKLLKQYNDYNNFLNGNTDKSDFNINDYEVYEKKLSSLMKTKNNKDFSENPIDYLKKKYEEKQEIFYIYFLSEISKEFSELYLIKESSIFSIFQINEIKDIFEMMIISNLDARKFFNSYFIDSLKKYIENKRFYTSDISLSKKDLKFDEYIEIFNNGFNQINADINSVKELYSLFYSFVSLYNEYKLDINE